MFVKVVSDGPQLSRDAVVEPMTPRVCVQAGCGSRCGSRCVSVKNTSQKQQKNHGIDLNDEEFGAFTRRRAEFQPAYQ